MNYSTKTIQLSIDEFPNYDLASMQIPANHFGHRTAILKTSEQIKAVNNWNKQEHHQLPSKQVTQEKEVKQFPRFYELEINRSFLSLLSAIIVIIAFIGGMVAICLSIASNNRSWHLLWLTLPLFLFVFFIGFRTISNFCSLHSEAKLITFSKYDKVPSANIIKIYQRAKVNYINLNWFSAGVYLIGTLVIIISLIVAWAYNLIQSSTKINQFGALEIYATQDWWPLYSIISCSLIMGLCLIAHLTLLVINMKRINAINAYYGKQIVPESEIVTIKKAINKRDAIIFGCVVCLLCLAGVFVYKFVRRLLLRKSK